MILALAVTVFRLAVQDLGPWHAHASGYALEFAAPKASVGKFVRLMLDKPARVRLNGAELSATPAREFDLLDLRREGNVLSCETEPGSARLLITPRVFASSAAQSRGGVAVTIRNTLENTANVSVTVRKPGSTGGPEAAATAGPGTAQTIELAGRIPGGRVEVVVQKEEEAVEGQYQFVAEFEVGPETGPAR